jgi:hypothetical protein
MVSCSLTGLHEECDRCLVLVGANGKTFSSLRGQYGPGPQCMKYPDRLILRYWSRAGCWDMDVMMYLVKVHQRSCQVEGTGYHGYEMRAVGFWERESALSVPGVVPNPSGPHNQCHAQSMSCITLLVDLRIVNKWRDLQCYNILPERCTPPYSYATLGQCRDRRG